MCVTPLLVSCPKHVQEKAFQWLPVLLDMKGCHDLHTFLCISAGSGSSPFRGIFSRGIRWASISTTFLASAKGSWEKAERVRAPWEAFDPGLEFILESISSEIKKLWKWVAMNKKAGSSIKWEDEENSSETRLLTISTVIFTRFLMSVMYYLVDLCRMVTKGELSR